MMKLMGRPFGTVPTTTSGADPTDLRTMSCGKALRLRTRERSVLRVIQGRLWATFDGPHQGAPNDLGDRVLGAGECLEMFPGRHLVIEDWCRTNAEPARFSVERVSPPGATGSASIR